jgi:hypothetical protein
MRGGPSRTVFNWVTKSNNGIPRGNRGGESRATFEKFSEEKMRPLIADAFEIAYLDVHDYLTQG